MPEGGRWMRYPATISLEFSHFCLRTQKGATLLFTLHNPTANFKYYLSLGICCMQPPSVLVRGFFFFGSNRKKPRITSKTDLWGRPLRLITWLKQGLHRQLQDRRKSSAMSGPSCKPIFSAFVWKVSTSFGGFQLESRCSLPGSEWLGRRTENDGTASASEGITLPSWSLLWALPQ